MDKSIVVTEELVDEVITTNLNTLKWGEALNDGFVVIPAALFRHQHLLKLDSGEVVVLLNLLMSWWKVNELPHIQTSTISKRMGISRRTAQRHIESLEKKQFIKRVWGTKRGVDERAGAMYDLSGTVTMLKEYGQIAHSARTTGS